MLDIYFFISNNEIYDPTNDTNRRVELNRLTVSKKLDLSGPSRDQLAPVGGV